MEIDTRANKRFFFVALIACLVPLLLIAAGNYTVDPYGEREVGIFPALQENSRRAKLRLYDELETKPEIVILGSSRVMQLYPEDAEAISGKPTFNLGVNSGNLADAEALYRYLREEKSAKFSQVILGVDLESFSPNVTLDQRLLEVQELQPYVDQDLLGNRSASDSQIFSDLSLDKTRRSFEVLSYEWRKGWPEPSNHFAADGHVIYDKFEKQIAAGTFDFQKQLERSVGEYRGRFHGFDHISKHSKRILARLLGQAAADGVRVAIFITPLHPEVIVKLTSERAYKERLSAVLELFSALARDHDFAFLDANALEKFGGDVNAFWDGAHIKRSNGRLILEKLLGDLR